MMIQTYSSDEIGDFLAFMTHSLGAEAVAARQPAAREDILKLMALAELPLPSLYHGYLLEFGAGDGALKMADDANPRVAALLELYQEQDPSNPDVPEHGVVIGAFGMSGERTLLYPPEWEVHDGLIEDFEPRVVVSWWGDVSHTCALTFRNHLYRQAFVRGCMAQGVHCSLYRNDPSFLPQARTHLINLGFEPYWFSDDHQSCLERSDGSCFYLESTNERTSLYGNLVDLSARSQIKEYLIATLELRDSSPNG